ncbi:MAG: hypothetical protein SH856_13620 [Flavobacteriales bacterium]|nr:hypothetical protein [Flavobacteriales bacterium]
MKIVITLILSAALGSANAQYWLLGGNDATATSRLGTNNAHNLNIWAGGQQRMTIKANNGAVGLGLTSPNYNMHILGTGNATAQHHGDIIPSGTESFL